MELKWKDKDYQPAAAGGLETVSGGEELLQRVLMKLSARRGSFPFLPELGSRLYLLGREPERTRQAVAEVYVRQALASEKELEVSGITLSEPEKGRWDLSVDLLWRGAPVTLSASLPVKHFE